MAIKKTRDLPRVTIQNIGPRLFAAINEYGAMAMEQIAKLNCRRSTIAYLQDD
jgi:hypothetical protein